MAQAGRSKEKEKRSDSFPRSFSEPLGVFQYANKVQSARIL